MIKRKKTIKVKVWDLFIWWDSQIKVQSMTNTKTYEIDETFEQIKELYLKWSELVRITVDNEISAKAVPEIIRKLEKNEILCPIIWDFHFNWHILLNKFPEMAKSLSKYRINPWNVWKWKKKDENFKKIIDCAIKYDKPVRIWINWGSLDDDLLKENLDSNWLLENPKSDSEIFVETMVESAILSANKAMEFWLKKDKIILSVKVSDVQQMISAYEKLSSKVDFPLHLWLTEAWWMTKWTVSTSCALAILLQKWIWDTIRVSITPEPWRSRTKEVEVSKLILQSLWIRYFQPLVTSCPWCWRTSSDKFQILSKQITEEIDKKMPIWKEKYFWFENLKIAVMWCIVNWPWESKSADIWISLPWDFEKPQLPVFIKWKFFKNLSWDNVFEEFTAIIENFLEENFSKENI